jgi:hypothetical protein
MEIETRKAHVLALNIKGPFRRHFNRASTLSEVIEDIHEAGGIAVIAHPVAVLKSAMGSKIPSESKLDAVEVMNSAVFPFFLSTYMSRRLAQRLKLPQTGGSDAHHPEEIGKAYTLVDADSSVDDIIEAIGKGKTVPYGKPISWIMRIERGASGVREALKRY